MRDLSAFVNMTCTFVRNALDLTKILARFGPEHHA
jgi:hypothetical protein